MSRKIKLTEEDINELVNNFKASLTGMRFDSDKITYTADTKLKEQKKIKVFFTPEAYCKMTTLIKGCEKEIAWHGTVKQTEDGNYIITDILMYPQEITGATVTSNDEKYPMWLMQQPDEVFNKIRFQGHSHVNFGATPSATDLTLYNNMLQTLSNEDFYIFMIMNKKAETWIQIYNLAENVVYENNDIEIAVLLGNKTSMEWFGEQCRDNIVERKVTYAVPTTPVIGGRGKKAISKLGDDTWKWDYIRKCYVPSQATDKQIKNCFEKAKKKATNKKSYEQIAAEELMELHDELQALEDDLENMARAQMLDDTKYNRVAKAIEKEQMSYWDDYYGGGFHD